MPITFRSSAGVLLRVTSTGHLELAPRTPPCMGYANGCWCPECAERVQRPVTAKPAAAQPWEPRKAA